MSTEQNQHPAQAMHTPIMEVIEAYELMLGKSDSDLDAQFELSMRARNAYATHQSALAAKDERIEELMEALSGCVLMLGTIGNTKDRIQANIDRAVAALAKSGKGEA